MRFSLVLALTLAALTVTAAAQKHQKPKAKPSYSEESKAKGANRTIKPPAEHGSAAQELRKIEQSSTRASGSRKAESSPTRSGPVLREGKKEVNPPIHATGGGSHAGKGKGSSDPYKGRLRHKGSHK